ncbi:hypothetical protein JCM10207_004763 [Rhodosporidiobolus poonsookiae]
MTSISSYSTRSRPPPHPLAANPEWVHRRFERAVDIIQSLPKSGPIQTNYDEKLQLYSVYKQATEGDVKASRPGMFDVLGRAKWDAWNKRKGLNQREAERLYVEALLKILRGFSDRTQAVELLRELETFSLDPPAGVKVGYGSIAPSRTESSHSSDSSTASYDDQSRMPPPPLQSSSHRQHPHRSIHSQAPAAPPSSTGARYHTPQPVRPQAPAPADAVAPPLPGYGPPRTRADSIRHARRHRRRDSRGSYSDHSSDDYTASEDDTRQYHPAPSQRSFAARGGPPPRVMSPPAHPSQLGQPRTPSIVQPQPQLHTLVRPTALHPMPSSLRSVAGSESGVAPSLVGAPLQQQVAVAYPPGFAPSAQQQRITVPSLTASNLLLRSAAATPTSALAAAAAASPSPAPAQPASSAQQAPLDAALDRIQTSLTALHERLALLESSSSPYLASSSSTSAVSLARDAFLRLLVLFHLRQPTPPSSPSISRTSTSARTRPSLLGILVRLALAVLRTLRRTAADALVVLAVVAVLGRLRGVDVPRLVAGWVVRYAVGERAGRRRVEGA